MPTDDSNKNHFRILGLSCAATDLQIRDAYFRLARKHHPDHNYGDPEAAARFKEIQLAYETLSKRIATPQPKESEQFPFLVPDPVAFTVPRYSLGVLASLLVIAAIFWGAYFNESKYVTEFSLQTYGSRPSKNAKRHTLERALPTETEPGVTRNHHAAFDRKETIAAQDTVVNDPSTNDTAVIDTAHGSNETAPQKSLSKASKKSDTSHNSGSSNDSSLKYDQWESWPLGSTEPLGSNNDYYSIETELDSYAAKKYVDSPATWESRYQPSAYVDVEPDVGVQADLDWIIRRETRRHTAGSSSSAYSTTSGTNLLPGTTGSSWSTVTSATDPLKATFEGSGIGANHPLPSITLPELLPTDTKYPNGKWELPGSQFVGDQAKYNPKQTPEQRKSVTSWSPSPVNPMEYVKNMRHQTARSNESFVDEWRENRLERAAYWESTSPLHSSPRTTQRNEFSQWEPNRYATQASVEWKNFESRARNRADDWWPNQAPAYENSWVGRTNYDKSRSQRSHKQGSLAQGNTLNFNGLDVHQNVLQPYASQANQTRDHKSSPSRNTYQSNRNTHPKNSKWNLPTAGW